VPDAAAPDVGFYTGSVLDTEVRGFFMKEQYIGDVKDYCKYRFLQLLCACTGLRLGVNWYLTPDDYTRQGNHGSISQCMDDLYETVVSLKKPGATIQDVENAGLLPEGTVYYNKPLKYSFLPVNHACRKSWQKSAMAALSTCDIVFLDPDTGVVANDYLDVNGYVKNNFYLQNAKRDGTRYASMEEMRDYLTSGKSLIVFQYGQRTGIEPQLETVCRRLNKYVGTPSQIYIFRYSKSTADAIAFICYNQTQHNEHMAKFATALLDEQKPWAEYFSMWEDPSMFSNELVNKGKIVEAATLSGGPIGKYVVARMKDVYKDRWWAQVERYFSIKTFPPRPLGNSDIQRADSLDVSKSMQLIEGFWDTVFKKYMQKMPDVRAAISTFNRAKHEKNQSGFTDNETNEALMTLIVVLEMTSNRTEAILLRQNYLAVGDKIHDMVKPEMDAIKTRQSADEKKVTAPQAVASVAPHIQPQPLKKAGSPQEKVRALVMKIPRGKVTTYGWLAKQIYGNTGTTPAVLSMIKAITGTASPCHRVVSSDGQPKAPDKNYGNTGKTHKELLVSEGVMFLDPATIDMDKCMCRPLID
jgi:alkylated DNA nucleotide flippase Atl1